MSRFKLKRFCLILFSITILYYLYALYATMNSASEEEDIERLINYQRNDPIRLFPEIEPRNRYQEISDNDRHIESNKKDWHDHSLIFAESNQVGPGEQGTGVQITNSEKEKANYQDLLSKNGFNAMASDRISLKRSLKDIRNRFCQSKQYLKKLPSVSIVIPFYDEHFSTLQRSIHSIVKRTPPELLVEIILVDDFSTKDFLNEPLETYVRENFKRGLIKIIRNRKREGLIRTRMAGADIAKGEILVFFDSHIECNANWLPPLIEPIAQNKTTCTCPFIDVISDETFAYSAQDEGARGAFDWQFYYKRLPLLSTSLSSKKNPTEPFDNPVMAGGLFAINREWFYHLGGYDKGLEVWGGEQYELSFKIWQCGGKIVDVPCSRVGHVYRKFNPFSTGVNGNYLLKNYKRVAETWMDEYKEFIYKHRPTLRNIDMGDISAQLEIKKRLECKPFKWFMETVAFDLVKYYPPVPIPPYASGQIKNSELDLCIEENFGIIFLDKCKNKNSQKFELTFRSDLRPLQRQECLDVSTSMIGAKIGMFTCHGMKGNQEFKYDLKSSHIYHVISNHCLDANNKNEVFMNVCLKDEITQKWSFESVNRTLITKDFSDNFLNL